MNRMTSEKRGSRAAAWVGTLTVLTLATVVALVSQLYLHHRLDLTRDREFTLSRAALKTLDNLPDIVTVRVVMSRDLPTQFQQARTQAVDLLREFEARSNGKFVLVFEDPGKDPVKRQAAASMGIREVQLQEQSDEGVQVKKGYFGIALLYGDKKEVFPVIESLETFEYELVVRLMKLTGRTKTIGIVEGAEGNQMTFALPGAQEPPVRGFASLFGALKSNMEQLYRIAPQYVAWSPIAKDVDLLLVAAPERLSEVEKFRIDQFVLSGRPVVFLTPGMNVDLSAGIGSQPSANQYEDLLAHYGLGVRKNMLLEPRQWELVRFGNAMFPSPYPYWIVPTYNTLNPDNPITAGLQSLSFPWTSSIEVDPAAQPGVKRDTLVSTSDQAWEESGNLYLYPRELNEYRPENQRRFPLAILETGALTSRYAAGAPEGIPPEESTGMLLKSRSASRVLVVSNALFVSDFYVGYVKAAGNENFVLNALDYLVLDPDLIGVRSREIQEFPLDENLKVRAKTPVIIANLAFAPLLLLLWGLMIAVRRRRRKRKGEGAGETA